MNIKDLAPKHINLDELKRQAPKFEGTEAELASLIKNGTVKPLVTDDGTVVGLNVHVTDDVELDAAARENFSSVYSGYTTMVWMQEIYSGEYEARLAREAAEKEATIPSTESTGDTVSVTREEISRFGSVKNAVRYKAKRCLARGCTPTITETREGATVSNIVWGRALSSSELAAM